MKKYNLWSLRLGYSSRQAAAIEKEGISNFLKKSFAFPADTNLPGCMAEEPKTNEEITAYRKFYKEAEDKKALRKEEIFNSYSLKSWWIGKMAEDEYPLREKMTFFWENHYVATFQKIKMNYWVYAHNNLMRQNAFGNFRELTKQAVRSNALIQYLDNNKNRNGHFNENLSRELLELFTLGIGNYTEEDIKNGAKGLAGLTVGDGEGAYRPKLEYNGEFTYFGEKGNFKSDEIVDIIFEQKNAPYLITEKLLKWFIYDNPPKELVTYYGDYLREQDFEIQPLLLKIFTEEFDKSTAGSKIKDPLVYILQLYDELNIKNQNHILTARFLADQSMDLFNQPNVKGWEGGNNWLTAQLYLHRNKFADLLCSGKNTNSGVLRYSAKVTQIPPELNVSIEWNKNSNSKEIITALKNRLLFTTDDEIQKDFESILKYDFDPNSEGADNGVMRLFNYMVKTPEFQLI